MLTYKYPSFSFSLVVNYRRQFGSHFKFVLKWLSLLLFPCQAAVTSEDGALAALYFFVFKVLHFLFDFLCNSFKVQLHRDRFGTVGRSTSRGSTAPQKSNYSTSKGRGEQVQLTGKNTFARPRSLKPLGWDANKPRTNEAEDEKPKSNDEFRQMFLKR